MSERSQMSELLFRVFFFRVFDFEHQAKIEKLEEKKQEKNFRDFRRFPGFQVFDLAGIEFQKHLLHTLPLGLGISCKACLLSLKNYSGDLLFDVLILGLFQIYAFMGQTHGEVSQALHSESEGSQFKPWLPVTLGSNKYQTLIKMGLVNLPLYSGPKLALGQRIAW